MRVLSEKLKRILKMMIGAVAFATFMITIVNADTPDEIAKRARREYATAQARWQYDLAELVIRTHPVFETTAIAQRDLQLAYIEQQAVRFEYLLDHNPSRIALTEGLSAFANFEWSDEDNKALIETDPSYAELEKRVSELRKKNDEQADWPQFREYFRDTLSKTKEYERLLNEFAQKQKEVEDMLQEYSSESDKVPVRKTHASRMAEVQQLAQSIKIGMTRSEVEKIFSHEDGGLNGDSSTRYYEDPEVMIEVPYDQTGGAWSPQNHVNGEVRVYRSYPHYD